MWLPCVSVFRVLPCITLMRRVDPFVVFSFFFLPAQLVTRHLEVQGHRPASFFSKKKKRELENLSHGAMKNGGHARAGTNRDQHPELELGTTRRNTPVLLRNKLRVNGTLLLCKNPLNGCSTNTLPTHFYVSHFAGCAILFNKDTISSDLLGSSVDIHDRKSGQHVVKEDQVLQAVISRGMVRRTPRNGNSTSQKCLHINNSYAKKRGIAKNVPVAVRTAMQQVDMVAGDFNGAAWRRKRIESQQCVSTIEEAFADTNLPVLDGTTPLW